MTTFTIFNFLSYYCLWLLLVTTNVGSQTMNYLLTALVIILHFIFSPYKKEDAMLCICVTNIGIIIDSLFTVLGLFSFSSTSEILPIPTYLVIIWALFSLLFNHSFKWLESKLLLSSLLGAIFAPLSYYAGHKLGAISFSNAISVFIILAITWAIIFPLFLRLSIFIKRLNQV